MQRLLGVLLCAAWLAAAPAVAGTFSGFPDAAVPLGNTADEVPLDQGAGCPTNTATCTTSRVSSLRLGQPIQTNCGAIGSPFQFQNCIDTSVNPNVLKIYIGAAWSSIASLSTISGYTPSLGVPVGVSSGGTGGSVASGTLLDNITGFASTGILDRTGPGAYSFLAAPAGTIVGTTDSQTLTTKVINGANNTLTVRAANDITGTLAVANGGTGDTGAAWTSYVPTLGCGAGTFTSAVGVGRYKTLGKTVFIAINVSVTTNGTCSGFVTATLPVQANGSSTGYELTGRNGVISGKMIVGNIQAGGTIAQIYNYDNTYPEASGEAGTISGVYEAQ